MVGARGAGPARPAEPGVALVYDDGVAIAGAAPPHSAAEVATDIGAISAISPTISTQIKRGSRRPLKKKKNTPK